MKIYDKVHTMEEGFLDAQERETEEIASALNMSVSKIKKII